MLKDEEHSRQAGGERASESHGVDRTTTHVGLLARDLHSAMSRAIDAQVLQYGLSSSLCRYLALISHHDGITPKELSEFLGVRSPTAVAALRTLEEKNLVARSRDQADGRRSPYHLTAEGRRIEKLVRATALEVERLALSDLSDSDVESLRRMIEVIRGSLTPTLPPN